jgi:hypothetical protein
MQTWRPSPTATKCQPSTYFCLSVFLSFCLSVFLSFCLSVFLSFCLSVFLSFCLSVFLSFCLSVFLFFCLSVSLSLCLFVLLSSCLSVYLSFCLSVFLSFCLSVFLSFCLSVFLSFCLSVFLSLTSYLNFCLCIYIYIFLIFIPDADLEVITNCHKLSAINFNLNNISSSLQIHQLPVNLKHFKSLTLKLSHQSFSADDLSQFLRHTNLSQLSILILTYTKQFTVEAMEAISSMKLLKELTLLTTDTNLSEVAVEDLINTLENCQLIEKALFKFRYTLPNLN